MSALDRRALTADERRYLLCGRADNSFFTPLIYCRDLSFMAPKGFIAAVFAVAILRHGPLYLSCN